MTDIDLVNSSLAFKFFDNLSAFEIVLVGEMEQIIGNICVAIFDFDDFLNTGNICQAEVNLFALLCAQIVCSPSCSPS